MKKVIVLVVGLFVLSTVPARAQSVADLIQQLIMDYEKLSELKTILSDMKTGYQIISTGYENIKDISEGNFNLHKLFLDGLLAVSPAVKNYKMVVAIINNQEQIVKEYNAAWGQFSHGNLFAPEEMSYISRVYGNLLALSLKNLDELTMVLTAGTLRMSDAERLASIDRINKDMEEKLSFLRYFSNNTAVQAQQRLRDQNDDATIKSLYGIGH